jgi:hypothetical protein
MVAAESYQPQQVSQGIMAFAALVALQNPRFIAGVSKLAQSPDAAEALVRGLETDPSRVAGIDGADSAAADATAALIREAELVYEAGSKVKQSSYDIQHQPWSLEMTPDSAWRLARAKSLANAKFSPSGDDIARLFQTTANARDQNSGETASPGYTPVVRHGLVLAALAVLGRADHQDLEAAGLIRPGDGADCMQLAKLNLFQCLAVAGPYYEDAFCPAAATDDSYTVPVASSSPSSH